MIPPRQSEFLPKVDERLQNIRGKIALALEVERPLSKNELWTMLYSLQGAVKILHDVLKPDVKKQKGNTK